MSRLLVGRNVRKVVPAIVCAWLLYGCGAGHLHREGMDLIAEGRYEDGIAKLEKASQEDTSDLHYRTDYFNQRDAAAGKMLREADNQRATGHSDVAEQLYRRVLMIDRDNPRAGAGVAEAERDRRHAKLLEEARDDVKKQDIVAALSKLRLVETENPSNLEMKALKRQLDEQQNRENMQLPTLRSMYRKPVSIDFYNANIKMIFDALSRTTGINFLFDKDVRSDLTASISIKNTYLENVMDLLLTTNQLEKKILNANTVLIYPNVPNKSKDYQDLVVKSFYLENADVKQTMSMVKTLLKTREIYADEKLNMMVMRDTPETIQLVEKLIAMQDLAEPEVMLEVEVLEVNRSSLLNLGIQYPSQLTLTPLSVAGGTTLTLNDLKQLNSDRIGASAGNLVVNAKYTDSDINLLANPRIRTRNREKAKIMIGDKVPVITTTSSSTGFVSGSVQYLDVGLKLDVEPTIYLQNDVAIKVGLEVSSIANQVTTSSGTVTYQIGSRSASTVLRLKDGETQVLAGLINDSDRASASKIPGLGEFPVLGRLFSSHQDDKQKTEIILSITPHLIRNLNRPDASASEFWSGSETTVRNGLLALPVAKPAVTPSVSASAQARDGSPDAGNAQASTPPAGAAQEDDVAKPNATQPPTAVALSWQGPKEVKVGDQFKMVLNLKTNGGMRSLPFQISYDTAHLRVVEVTEGEFFKQNGGQSNFTSNVDAAAGRIFVGVTRSGSDGAVGAESVAVINFKALSEQPKSEIRLLTATPVGVGNQIPTPDMPDPHVLTITP